MVQSELHSQPLLTLWSPLPPLPLSLECCHCLLCLPLFPNRPQVKISRFSQYLSILLLLSPALTHLKALEGEQTHPEASWEEMGRGKHKQLAPSIFISVDLCYKTSNTFATQPFLFRAPCPFNLTWSTTLPVSSQRLSPTRMRATCPFLSPTCLCYVTLS